MVTASGTTSVALWIGWAIAQFGYAGAIAISRTALAEALPIHRQRGAVASVLASDGGLAVPLLLMIVFPDRIWSTTFELAGASILVPFVFMFTVRREVDSARAHPTPISVL